jgi:ADP-ribose pyrophosphatase
MPLRQFGRSETMATKGRTGSPSVLTRMKQLLHAGTFLALFREGHWEYAERVKVSGAAVILALTPGNRLLLVEQYRIPLHARTIELPAGIIGDSPELAAESHPAAARRELLEETGYAAERIEMLVSGPVSGGMTSEIITLFRATGLKRIGVGGGVDREEITVHEVPVAEIRQWLEARAAAGILIDVKVFAGLYFLDTPPG